jgi:hypothetical protein
VSSQAPAKSATPIVAMAIRCASFGAGAPSPTLSSASSTSRAEAKRSFGVRARQRNTSPSTSRGTAGFTRLGGGSPSCSAFGLADASAAVASNGICPVSISNQTTPNEYTSLAGV